MNTKDFIKRLTYTKYIYNKGMEFLSQRTPVSDALSILLFHDASEQLLLIVADKLGISTTNITFLDYWEKVKKKSKHLPNKNEISKLNKMRVGFKHHGILPNHEECRDISYVLNSFFSSVSHDILDIDFSNLSLADLINYDEVRDCIKNAENFLIQENFEESIVESAKAFAFLEKRMEGDYYHSFVISDLKAFNGLKEAERTISIGMDRDIDKCYREGFREAREKLQEIIKNLNPLLLGIEIRKYQKFKLLTPVVNVSFPGQTYVSKGGYYQNRFNFNKDNALFCINVVIDSALKFQTEPFGLFDERKTHIIKIKNAKTNVYSYKDNKFVKIGSVEKDEIFEKAKLVLVMDKHKDYWNIEYKDEEVYIELDDAEWIREKER
jgi:hypothetical protein